MSKVQMPDDVEPADHPDFVGGIVWAGCELRAIERRDIAWRAYAEKYAAAKVAEAVEQCAQALESTGNDHCAAAIRRMKEKTE